MAISADHSNDAPKPLYLYERLGGRGGIDLIVEQWRDRVIADPKFNQLTAGVAPDALKQAQLDFLIQVARDGPGQMLLPCQGGVPHEGSTRRLQERLLSHLIAALVWANVPRVEIEEVLDAVTPLGPAVLALCFGPREGYG